jgi:signal transduction histidine kinase
MLQFINVSKDIMYEQVHAENEFLAITNATVSHELRNPLQSISSQNLKIQLCIKELQSILEKNQNKTVNQIDKAMLKVIKMI